MYRATEEARVAKWLSRFSADDSGISGVDLAPKPGLQVHMRPPVFDRKVYEATEAVKGDKEAAKVVSEKKKDGLVGFFPCFFFFFFSHCRCGFN